MRPKSTFNRPIFLTTHRPYRIRSVLLAVAVGMVLGAVLAKAV